MIKISSLLSTSNSSTLAALKEAGTLRTYPAGKIIFSEDQASEFLYYIEDGNVSFSFYGKDGKKFIIGIGSNETFFGELEVFSGSPRISSAVALSDSKILSIPKKAAINIIKSDVDLLLNTLSFYSRRLEELLHFSLTMEIEKRLSLVLIELAENFGKKTKLGIEIGIKVNQETLASMVGKPRQRINKILKTWEGLGWIKINPEKITICDFEKLSTEAGNIS